MSTDYEKYVSGLIARAKAAQEIANSYSQQRVDELCAAIAYRTTRPDFAQQAADMLVEESGMGLAANKVAKIYTKVKGGYRDMKGKPSVGLVDTNEVTGVTTYAKPMGIIGAVIPITNGEATPIFKAIAAIKGRNAIILAPHPKGAKTNAFVANKIRETLKAYGAPEDLVIAIDPEYVSIECSGELMRQVDFVLATGGTPMVRAAYSSGTPTIGVGTGNVVTIVDGTSDLDKAAELIIASKTFDNATSCSTENNLVVLEECYDRFIEAMARKGATLIKEGTEDKEKMLKTLWPASPADHVLNRHIIAQPAAKIAEIAGVCVPEGTVLILVEENGGYGNDFPFTGEKLSPVAGVRKAKDFNEAVEQLEKILDYQGLGHSCGIHTSHLERAQLLGERIKVTKVVMNMAQSLVNSGAWTCGYPMSMTLGCGTWGHNSISHNATWKDLLNFTYLATPIPS
ncbi:MAG: aldehyde dehydrogenase family protein, partial [Eubacteriales bacterium]|nr:aldehyde dehydrogenase family protein [Eubacteriales bacterium]